MSDRLADEMRRHRDALIYGFNEHIEFVVEINGGYERRGAVRRFEALLTQLETNSITPLTASGQSGPGSPNKAGSRPPLNQAYADLVDTIHEQAIAAWLILEQDQPPIPLTALLDQLYMAVLRNSLAAPQGCEKVVRMASDWVKRARVLLGFETRTVVLSETVCGQCGGTLVVAADASTDVRCIGTQAAESCGMVYGRLQWLSLALSGS